MSAPPRAGDATTLLDAVVATYAHARTYSDRGTVRTVFTSGGHQFTKLITLRTAFVRPDRLRFEYDDTGDPAKAMVIAWDGTTALATWWLEPRPEQYDDLSMALDAAAGVSHGTSVLVPGLLLPGELDGIDLTALAGARVLDHSPLDGHRCVRITATGGLGSTYTVWIDEQSHVLRRIVDRHRIATDALSGRPIPPFDVEQTTDLDPALDQPIAGALLAPPDLHGQAPLVHRSPPWLGIELDHASPRITAVLPGSPAEHAGLRVGDTIAAVDGTAAIDTARLVQTLGQRSIGAHLVLTIERDGVVQPVTVVMAKRPPPRKLQALVDGKLLGRPAPPFALPGVGGGTVASADLAGHVVVLDFWATWCGPCRMTSPHLAALQAKYAARGVRVIGISDEDASAIVAYTRDHAPGYTLARDPSDHVTAAYQVTGLPTIVVIDRGGVVRFVTAGAGELGKVEHLVDQLAPPAGP